MTVSITENYDGYYFSVDVEFDVHDPVERESVENIIDKYFFRKKTPVQE